jgi:methionyl-tRNA synthetase
MTVTGWTPEQAVRAVHGGLNDYLIVPVMPTPNGRLHLGHIAGPFLKCDVLRRHLRQFGYDARVISGSDAYESHVTVKAAETGASPAAVARRYHHAIGNDLAGLDILFDDWASPLDPDFREIHDRFQQQVLDDFQRAGLLAWQREKVPYRPEDNRFLLGGWLSGRCPQCGDGAGGYFCESCGAHFRPEELVEPEVKGVGDRESRAEVPVDSLFLRVSDPDRLASEAARLAVPEEFRTALTRYLAHNEGLRLTAPGRWGVGWPAGDRDVHRTIFSYAGLFAFALACGEIDRAARRRDANPFERGAGVVTITACGFDNAVPFLASVQGFGLEHPVYRGFDHHLTNMLMRLEGRKFSTSRRHGIWVADVLARTSLASDTLRFYLARHSPEDGASDMEIGELAAFNNRLADRLEAIFGRLAQLAPEAGDGPSQAAAKRIEDTCRRFAEALDPSRFALRDGAGVLETWIDEADAWLDDPVSAYWWSKTLALIATPIMPRFGRQLWALLGHVGEPHAGAFAEPTRPEVVADPGISRVSERAIRAAAA